MYSKAIRKFTELRAGLENQAWNGRRAVPEVVPGRGLEDSVAQKPLLLRMNSTSFLHPLTP